MYNMTTTRRVSNYDGLRRKPPMEELVSYLANHQETTRFPNREAKQIRNHPYRTQLDFFDMQDEQQKAWEEQKRKEEMKQLAQDEGSSLALVGATEASRRGGGRPYQFALGNNDDDDVEEILRSEADTMRNQREDRSRAMTIAVRQHLGGLASNPGSDVPQPITSLPGRM